MTATYDYLPKFKQIDVNQVTKKVTQCLEYNKEQINQLLTKQSNYTWDNLIYPLESLDDNLHRLWAPISHMHSVIDNEELRKAYNQCIPLLSDYGTELGQNEQLYQAIVAIANHDDTLDDAQQKSLSNDIRDFRLAGVALSEEKKQQFKTIKSRLSQLTTQFEENVLDATTAWTKQIEQLDELSGIPEHAIESAKAAAEQKGKPGYLLNLEFPCYYAVISYADNAELRKEMYTAYATRASDQGPQAGQFDNTQVINEIVALRQQAAQLLGFQHYAEYSLASKMADNSEQVLKFLTDLAVRCKDQATKEYQELSSFAREHYQQDDLASWDIPYYSEKLRAHRYAISQEDLRPYFPQDKVISGMFSIVNKLYGIRLEQVDGIETWHKDVQFFNLLDEHDQLRGQLYMDLYARPHKRGGAWMDECLVRRKLNQQEIQTPVAYLTCNFAGPSGGKPALFSHEEVITLFHEFGHCLHHLLTKINYSGVSGINGVPWDAVELPSQFFENWCWQREALDLISSHYQTGEAIPEELFYKLIAAKNFQSAMQMLRQLEFSIFDFRLHAEYQVDKTDVQQLLDDVRAQISVVPVPKFNRFQHGFSHIFAGGYAAGYYSYKWAEVLSSDAFSRFEEEGVFNQQAGRDFLHHILEQGGSKEPMELFIQFRGREPSIDPLLAHNGIL